MNEPKTYCNAISGAKERTFRDNGSILCIGINAGKMVEFLEQNKNEKGFVNLVLAKRRTPSEHGDTHYAYLDTWKPTPREGGDAQPRSKPQPQQPSATPPAEGFTTGGTIDNSDVPF